VDALRALMIQGGQSVFGLGADLGVHVIMLTLLVGLVARLYPGIIN
jgi:hypothetical protein